MIRNTLFLNRFGGFSRSSGPSATQRCTDIRVTRWGEREFKPIVNTNAIQNNRIDTSAIRFFFSRRRRSGRSRASLKSRIKRKQLETELGSSASGLTSFSKLYAVSKSPHPLHPRPEFMRYLDPWYDLATLCQKQEDLLTDKLDSVTRMYGVLATLMCSLSAALLAVDFPSIPENTQEEEDQYYYHRSNSRQINGLKPPEFVPPAVGPLRRRSSFIEHVVLEYPNHAAGTSLLVSWGVPPQRLHDAYAGSCALSFYTSLTATGLAGILNAWLSATPPGGVSTFCMRFSKFVALVPALLGASTLSTGTALFVGLDRSKGTPVSYFGLGGIISGYALLCVAALRGWNVTYRLIRRLAQKVEKRNRTIMAAASK
ncbi:unnamed protein product [Pseudo-nitzschia multistriata]|uniref:Uncharacterized protein n=1 Tax=Pseudo-nitzschia multistriata TaxID=183589 RepID=A0A448ZJC0_9STRA|nr:unnamed protein product [Pseudo-nitzschia multistriata]